MPTNVNALLATRREAHIINRMIREYRGPGVRHGQAQPVQTGPNIQWIKATSTSTGVLTSRDGYSGVWEDGTTTVQVVVAGGGTMTVGSRYIAVQTGHTSGNQPQFVAFCQPTTGAGGDINVWQKVDTDTIHPCAFPGGHVSIVQSAFDLTTNGGVYANPFLARSGTIDRIGITAQISAPLTTNIRIGIYQDNGSIYPGALVVDSGTIAVTTIDGYEATVSASLAAGTLYWSVLLVDNDGQAGFSASVISEMWNPLGYDYSDFQNLGNLVYRVGYQLTGIGALAALPATFTAGASYILNSDPASNPCVFVRYSA